jgi:hypothetical protein
MEASAMMLSQNQSNASLHNKLVAHRRCPEYLRAQQRLIRLAGDGSINSLEYQQKLLLASQQ